MKQRKKRILKNAQCNKCSRVGPEPARSPIELCLKGGVLLVRKSKRFSARKRGGKFKFSTQGILYRTLSQLLQARDNPNGNINILIIKYQGAYRYLGAQSGNSLPIVASDMVNLHWRFSSITTAKEVAQTAPGLIIADSLKRHASGSANMGIEHLTFQIGRPSTSGIFKISVHGTEREKKAKHVTFDPPTQTTSGVDEFYHLLSLAISCDSLLKLPLIENEILVADINSLRNTDISKELAQLFERGMVRTPIIDLDRLRYGLHRKASGFTPFLLLNFGIYKHQTPFPVHEHCWAVPDLSNKIRAYPEGRKYLQRKGACGLLSSLPKETPEIDVCLWVTRSWIEGDALCGGSFVSTLRWN